MCHSLDGRSVSTRPKPANLLMHINETGPPFEPSAATQREGLLHVYPAPRLRRAGARAHGDAPDAQPPSNQYVITFLGRYLGAIGLGFPSCASRADAAALSKSRHAEYLACGIGQHDSSGRNSVERELRAHESGLAAHHDVSPRHPGVRDAPGALPCHS
jgi:hypothetical protein